MREASRSRGDQASGRARTQREPLAGAPGRAQIPPQATPTVPTFRALRTVQWPRVSCGRSCRRCEGHPKSPDGRIHHDR